jgi:ribonuclease HI
MEAMQKNHTLSSWHLYVDGAARNNPGPAGAGIYMSREGRGILKKGHFLGMRTNNQAEYLALLLGLFYLHTQVPVGASLEIFADSQLLVRQLQGIYRVKDPILKSLQQAAFSLLMAYSYSITHIFRYENQEADALANYGIDKKILVPEAFLTFLKNHDVSW